MKALGCSLKQHGVSGLQAWSVSDAGLPETSLRVVASPAAGPFAASAALFLCLKFMAGVRRTCLMDRREPIADVRCQSAITLRFVPRPITATWPRLAAHTVEHGGPTLNRAVSSGTREMVQSRGGVGPRCVRLRPACVGSYRGRVCSGMVQETSVEAGALRGLGAATVGCLRHQHPPSGARPRPSGACDLLGIDGSHAAPL